MSRSRIWPIAAAGLGLVFAACGSGVGPPGAQVDAAVVDDSGTPIVAATVCASVPGNRLKREYIEPTAGARQEYRIMDALHDVECKFQAEDDGVYTCYPILSATTGSVFYQDANCTSALARFAGAAEPTQFTRYVRPSALPCGAPIQEHRLVGSPSPVTSGQDIFVRNLMGACVALVAPSGDYFVAGPALDSTDFITATVEASSASSRVSDLTFVGNDDSRMCATGLPKRDSMLNVSCENRLGGDGESYCMPIGGSSETHFTDDVCETATAMIAVGACESPTPSYAVDDEADSCGAITRTVTTVLPDAVTNRYRVAGNNCQLVNPNTLTYYALDRVAVDSEFVALSVETEESEGRVKRLLNVSTDRFGEFTNLWFDSVLESNCQFAAANDGSFRCLPIAMPTKTLYSDMGCTMAVEALAVAKECQGKTDFLKKAGAMGLQIFVAKPYTDPAYELAGLECTLIENAVFAADFEQAASSFQLGEIVLQ